MTFTAFVQAVTPGAGTPSGTVSFSDGSVAIGAGVLDGTGHATFSTSSLAIGSHSITASYGGDRHFNERAHRAFTAIRSPRVALSWSSPLRPAARCLARW